MYEGRYSTPFLWSGAALRSFSFGRVHRVDEQPGGLFDPRIFGHKEDFTCLCGPKGDEDNGRKLCDVCHAPIGLAAELTTLRFGHIDFALPIPHPWNSEHLLECILVLPIGLRIDNGCSGLSDAYARILGKSDALTGAIKQSPLQKYELLAQGDSTLEFLVSDLAAEFAALVGDSITDKNVTLVRCLVEELVRLGAPTMAYARAIGFALEGHVRV